MGEGLQAYSQTFSEVPLSEIPLHRVKGWQSSEAKIDGVVLPQCTKKHSVLAAARTPLFVPKRGIFGKAYLQLCRFDTRKKVRLHTTFALDFKFAALLKREFMLQ